MKDQHHSTIVLLFFFTYGTSEGISHFNKGFIDIQFLTHHIVFLDSILRICYKIQSMVLHIKGENTLPVEFHTIGSL